MPERNARSACSRAPWPRSPWIAAAAKPRSTRSSATFGGGALRAGEDQRQAAFAGLQHAGEHLGLVHRVRAVDELVDVRRARRLAALLGADLDRLDEELPGQRDDRAGHGGREQHRLPGRGHHRQQLLDVGQEAEVEHLVGLVEDEDARVGELEVALLGEVEQPPGRADDDVDALACSASICGS